MDLKKTTKTIKQKLFETKLFKGADVIDKLIDEGRSVAIDLGAASVKVLEVERSPKGLSLINAVYKELPLLRNDESRSGQTEEDIISRTLSEIWHENKIKAKKVRLVISDPGVYLRHIDIPQVAEEELAKAIKWQAEKYTPFPIDGAIVDFQTTDSSITDEQGQINVIIVAVKREVIERYLNILKAAKLIPNIIDIAPFATARSIMNSYTFEDDEIVPVIDIGKKASSITILNKKSLLFVRNFEISGQSFTKAVADSLGLDMQEAENRKREKDFLTDQPTDDNLYKDVLSELILQIERSFAYIERSHLTKNIRTIFLCGGGAKLKGIAGYLEKKLGITVKVADPFANLKVENKNHDSDEFKEAAPCCASVLGELI